MAEEFGSDEAGHRFKADFPRNSEDSGSEPRETTGAIAAHFGFATVSVKITHSEVGSGGVGGFRGDESVGSDAAVAVAKACNEFALEGQLSGAVVDHDEVVSCAVHFGEREHGGGYSTGGIGCATEERKNRLRIGRWRGEDGGL